MPAAVGNHVVKVTRRRRRVRCANSVLLCYHYVALPVLFVIDLCDITVHQDIVANAAAHDKQMEKLVRSKILILRVKKR